ncbi:MAG: hypothetical protein V4592_04800 [Bacteroidota bacterium]
MKKSLLAIIALLSALPFLSNAQTWSGTTPGNIYYNSGNVGLGTTSPISGGAAASWLTLNGTSTYSGGVAYAIGGDVKGFSYIDPDGALTQQSLYTGQKFVVNTSTTAMAILSSGNIGIGTTNPTAPLQVNGAIYTTTSDYSKLSTGSALSVGTGTTTGNTYGIIQQSNNGGTNAGNMVLNPYGGNIGIGTLAPDEKLTVYGKIHSQEVKVDLSVPGPDYVFEPTYKLPTLSEIKTFVDKNHHLPEIPSAAEMVKNGLDLGDMNTKLLKKVEELTLYLIEQQKQVEALRQTVKALSKQIHKNKR